MISRMRISILTAVLVASPIAAQTNTLLILGDDMGVDTVGAYKEGATPAPTPTLDKLAKNGVLFRNAYASAWCTPSRANYMTGRYGFRTGVGRAGAVLPLSETVLPEILPSTYAHACIGKWHLGGNRGTVNHPNQTGWGHFSGALAFGISNFYSWPKVVNGRTSTSTVYATTDNVNDTLAWIKAQKKPWVVSLNFNAPHSPYHAPPSNLHTYNLTGKNPRTHRVLFYKAMLQAMDTEIGRLLAGIPAQTLAKTNIIFLGDNGTPGAVTEAPFDSTHAKTTLYEGGINVPLIVSGPAVRSPGREVTALVHAVDLFNTIAEFSGVDARKAVSAELDGISLVPYLSNPTQEPIREFVYSETFGAFSNNGTTVRNERYKLMRLTGRGDQLYDLKADPFEKVNLLAKTLTREQRENRDRLASELARLQDVAAWFTFGVACAGSAKPPVLGTVANDRPVLGQTFTTEVTDIKTGVLVGLGMLGFSRKKFGAIPLPLDLAVLKAPGCSLYVAPAIVTTLAVSSNKATWKLPLPAITNLAGLRLYQQAAVVETGANPLNLVFANAGEACLEIK